MDSENNLRTMDRPESRCCGCSLRTCTLIVLWPLAVMNVSIIFLSIYLSIYSDSETLSSEFWYADYLFGLARASAFSPPRFGEIVFAGIQLFSVSIALHGAHKKDLRNLTPFILINGITVIVLVVLSCRAIILLLTTVDSIDDSYFLHPKLAGDLNSRLQKVSIFLVVLTAFELYSTVVVYRYFNQMLHDDDDGTDGGQPAFLRHLYPERFPKCAAKK